MNDTLMDIFSQPKLDYDYTQIPDPTDRETVQRCAADIKPRLRRAAEDIVVIGQRLNEVKARLPHGQWLPWLATEFEMSETIARDFMRVATRFSVKSGIIPDLTPTALYLLARPSTPDAAIEEVEQRIAQAAPPTVAETKTIIAQAKAPANGYKSRPTQHATRNTPVTWGDEDFEVRPSDRPAKNGEGFKTALAQALQDAARSYLSDRFGGQAEVRKSNAATQHATHNTPTDNALLSVDNRPAHIDGDDMTWGNNATTDDHLYLDNDDPQDDAEVQRRWLLSVLDTCVTSLDNPRLLAITEEYAYSIEFSRLLTDARFLRDAIASLTPDDRI